MVLHLDRLTDSTERTLFHDLATTNIRFLYQYTLIHTCKVHMVLVTEYNHVVTILCIETR
jgi:hypothetical protein